ncbi:hypothetical protein [Myroides sp. TSA_177.3]|uniref:hypothetical protein n=1 Tax=Myroides sp. TSA_177.3 TaxID=3415650 RepID=UPI004045F20C
MMRIEIILISMFILTVSCQKKSDSGQVVDIKTEKYNYIINDTLAYLTQIDKESIKDTIIDVLPYFNTAKFPKIYRLGGIAYEPFFLNGDLVKINLIFEGDRETLTKTYYFNKQKAVFYVVRIYTIFDPPKWEENSKIKEIKQSDYYVLNGTIIKSKGDDISDLEISNDIIEVMRLVGLLSLYP